MGIRLKIVSGFVILASMLVISGSISIYELTKLGRSVNNLLRDNYRSIDYSKGMLNSLLDQEKAFLLALNGNIDSSKSLYAQSIAAFTTNLDLAAKNLTVTGEDQQVDSIKSLFLHYQTVSSPFFDKANCNSTYYLNSLYAPYIKVYRGVEELLTMNQSNLIEISTLLENSPYRAILPGLIVIITSIVFSIIFNYMINHYIVNPIIKLTRSINDYVKYKRPFEVTMETRDELYQLKDSVSNLIATSKSTRKAE
jgi:methyl-accepting chemotaxis protein